MTDALEFQKFFDFDLWANQRWLPAALEIVGGEEILLHIVVVEELWLKRCMGTEVELASEELPLADRIVAVHGAWKSFLANADLSATVSFTLRSGESYASQMSEIVRHCLNHGTYHRGDLRGLFRAAGREDFPESDYVRWLLDLG